MVNVKNKKLIDWFYHYHKISISEHIDLTKIYINKRQCASRTSRASELKIS